MSYFLWSSAPDQELLDVATAGKLCDEKVLRAQVQRMLDEPEGAPTGHRVLRPVARASTASTSIAAWTPSASLSSLTRSKTSMYDEAVSFFEHIIRKDRPVREIVCADYTFLNKDLAKIYGIWTPRSRSEDVTWSRTPTSSTAAA